MTGICSLNFSPLYHNFNGNASHSFQLFAVHRQEYNIQTIAHINTKKCFFLLLLLFIWFVCPHKYIPRNEINHLLSSWIRSTFQCQCNMHVMFFTLHRKFIAENVLIAQNIQHNHTHIHTHNRKL